MARKKKKQGTSNFMKGSLLTFLAGAIGVNYMKNLLFGNPPQTWRKVTFWSAAAGAFLYQRLDLDEKLDEYMELRQGEQAEYISELEEKVASQSELLVEKGEKVDSISLEYDRKDFELKELKRDKERQIYDLERSIHESTESSKSLEESKNTLDKIRSEEYWYIFNEGDELEDIAESISGNSVLKQDIKKMNGITREDDLLPGHPLKIPDYMVVNDFNLKRGNMPENQTIWRSGDSYIDFLRIHTGATDMNKAKEMERYNAEFGNELHSRAAFLSTSNRVSTTDQVVYLPEGF